MFKGYTELVVEQQKKLLLVQFNNPKKKNCLNRFAYIEITRVLCEAAQEDQVTIVVFTGTGDFYSAGNDLSQFENVNDLEASITESIKIFKEMVKAFVECPKVIVSLVNGPCIGIGTTLAGLSDMVWCSKKVRLSFAPFVCNFYINICYYFKGLFYNTLRQIGHSARSRVFLYVSAHYGPF